MKFEKIDVTKANVNPFQRIGQDWMLISAKKEGKVNTMTASWGMMGVFWGKNVVTVGIRPQRFTKEFVDAGDTFTLTFFDGERKQEMGYLGKVSGRDEDKISKVNFHVVETEEGEPTFEEGTMVFVCKKLMETQLNPEEFIDPEVDGRYYGMYWDPTYILVIIGMVICLLASARVKSTYAKFNRVRSHSGITAAEAAEKILHGAGIYDVEIRHISGDLTDNYDPSNRVLNLSDATFRSSSVAAIGVAAHECGHAIQDAESYAPLKIRGAIVPVVNFGATISWPLILIGIVLGGSRTLIMLGVLLFSLTVIFQLVTLPVEFNASSRALKILGNSHILYDDEISGARKVLTAAALTYVAAAASSILQLLRLLLLFGDRRDD